MAYEKYTFDFLLNRMLERISAYNPNLDIREGSMIYNAVAPEAIELAIAYTELDNVKNEGFISTASRWGKLEKCKEQGLPIDVLDASVGKFKGVFNVQVEIGSRWNLDLHNYQVESYIGQDADSRYEYVLVCETYGTSANGITGSLTPIDDTPAGLTYAELTECLVEGENESTDEEIAQYYLNHINGRIADGNISQYEAWCDEYDGIGRYKIFPLWNGDNTVKVSILSTSNEPASEELVAEFQNYLDPNIEGMGNGVAPIGAFVTVSTADTVALGFAVKVVVKDGFTVGSIDEVVSEYFSELAYQRLSDGNYVSTVKVIELASRVLRLPWVDDITDYTLYKGEINTDNCEIIYGNYNLQNEEIPVLGGTSVVESSGGLG